MRLLFMLHEQENNSNLITCQLLAHFSITVTALIFMVLIFHEFSSWTVFTILFSPIHPLYFVNAVFSFVRVTSRSLLFTWVAITFTKIHAIAIHLCCSREHGNRTYGSIIVIQHMLQSIIFWQNVHD